MKYFVYGTLRKGESRNHILKDAEFICHAILQETNYVLYDLKAFPAVVHKARQDVPNRGRRVFGEIYDITDNLTIASLDRIEGYPDFYGKVTTLAINYETGVPHTVLMYTLTQDQISADEKIIESGDWLNR